MPVYVSTRYLTRAVLAVSLTAQFSASAQSWEHVPLTGGPAIQIPEQPTYDPATNRMIIFGGLSAGPCCASLNEVWVVVNASGLGGTSTWNMLEPLGDLSASPSLPAPRNGHSAVYDQANNRLIIFGGGQFGGSTYNTLFNDVWVLTNANGMGPSSPQWIQLNASGGPPAPREGQRAVYDPGTNRMIVFGGGNNGIMDVPNDVWVLTNANGLGGSPEWILAVPAGANAPAQRQGHGMAYDPATNRMIVFGGCCGQLGDLWILQDANDVGAGATWLGPIAQGTPAPGPKSDFAFGYNVQDNRLIVTNGLNASRTATNDLWVLSNANDAGSPAWTNPIPNGQAGSPPAGNPTGAYDMPQDLFVAFTDTNDLWILSNADGAQGSSTGTIVVTTNLSAATFSITGLASYTGSGTDFTQTAAPTGTYTITFNPVAGYSTPVPQIQSLSPSGTITFNATYAVSRVTLTSLTGWTLGDLVIDAEWTGQPTTDTVAGTNGYDHFYAVDACQSTTPCSGVRSAGRAELSQDPVWHINGSGFCPPAGCSGKKGSLVFSDPMINSISASNIKTWTDSEITFTPSFMTTAFNYTVNTNVSVTMTTPDGLVATLPLPTPAGEPLTPGVIATIDGRGYGQCTWYVANQRLAHHLPIPVGAYYTVGSIDGNYTPEQWDVVNFDKAHTAIIISPVTKQTEANPDGSSTIKYSFTIGEMNVGVCPTTGSPCEVKAWSQQASTVGSNFTIAVSPSGTISVKQKIVSLDTASTCHETNPNISDNATNFCAATGYFR
jgi:Kelch motif